MKKQVIFLLISFLPFLIYAQTTIPGGDVNTGTWVFVGSPYEVTGNITLPSGNTLTIEPGVEVVFMNDYSFAVEGKLQAIGNDVDSIWFYPTDTVLGWQGIRFLNQNTNGQDSSKLEYCKIKYGKADGPGEYAKGGGIYCSNSSELLINNSEVSHNLADIGGGIYCDASSHPLITLTTFEYNQANSGGGMYCDNSNLQLNSSYIRLNQATINGGGIYCNGGSPIFNYDTLSNNHANEGGGMYPSYSNVTIHHSSIHHNTALINGGGIFQLSSSCIIFDSDISFNEAQGSGSYQGGGGIYIRFGSLNLARETFESNSTNQTGGAIHCQKATIIADSVEFINNSAVSVGGAIYSHDNDNITFSNSQFKFNQGLHGGGIYTSQHSTIGLEKVTFLGNSAIDFGGGASFAHSYVNLSNVEFKEDTAAIGGGFSIYECYSFQIDHVLVTNNHATDKGGGVLFRDSPGTNANFLNVTFSKNTAVNNGKAIYTTINDNLTLNNCIVWDHLSPTISGTGTLTATYSDIEGGYTGVGNIDFDPQFTDPDNEDYTLAWDNYPFTWGTKSPCIDAGDPVSPADPDGTIADMGAFYFHQTTTPISGNINDTLKCSESPYLVMGDLTVVSGEELVIEPCVRLVFMGDYKLEVQGRLLAQGNATDSIWFYPSDTLIGWQGIRLLNQNTNGQDSSRLEYCIIEYSNGNGIYCEASKLEVKNSLIRNNNSKGIYIVAFSGLALHNSMIMDNKTDGLYIEYESTLNSTNTNIINNLNGGIYITTYCDITLSNVNSNGNGGTGVYASIYSTLLYSGGSVSNNHDGGLIIENFYDNITLENLIVQNNEKIGNGGGIYIIGDAYDNSYASISNLLIDNNSAISGGGIYCSNHTITVLDSCVISNNEADLATGNGGGIYLGAGAVSLTMSNSSITDCQANNGGGIYCKFSTIVLDSTLVSNNTGNTNGGGIYADSSNMNLQYVNFIENTATTYTGGGIYCLDADLILHNTFFDKNQSYYSGGGIYAFNQSLLNISNSEFNQNVSLNDWGGAIHCTSSTGLLENIIIDSCSARYGGGLSGLYSSYELSKVNITNCYASDLGGGIKISGNSITELNYVIIALNSTNGDGGGLFFENTSEVYMTNTTVSNNDAIGEGGAIYTNSNLPLEITNSIIYYNIQGPGGINADYSLIYPDFHQGIGNIWGDAYFVDGTNGNYSLRWDNYPFLSGIKSPCIDKGDPTSPKDPDSTRCDMGAIPYMQNFTALEEGDIYDTLFCAESPYFVFGDLTVPTGQELVIEPCVNVIFQGDYRLQVNGRLLAQGNDSTFIYFRSGDTDEGWQGIRFYDQNTNGQDSSWIEYCDIRYGNADGPGEDAKGGGLYFNNSSEVAITDLNIYYCNATDKGGGIYIDSSNIQIQKGYFYYNDANYGGGIYCQASNLNINNAEFYDNDTKIDGGAIVLNENSTGSISNALFQHCTTVNNGGAITIYESDADISESEFKYCGTNNQGGGICAAYSSNLLINNSNFVANSADNKGGGIYAHDNSELTIDNSEFLSNWAGTQGGGIGARISVTLNIHNSILKSNHSNVYGGAIMIETNSNLMMENALITNNLADDKGGGIFSVGSSSINLLNVTVSKNDDIGAGSAIYCQDYYIVKNSIIWDNTDPQLFTGGGYSFSYSNAPAYGPGMFWADPKFKDPDNGDFNLMWANFPINDTTKSPCINTGDPNSPLDPDSTRADMGALYFDHYRYSPVITSIVDVPNDQGKQLVISWDKSPLDQIDTAKITHYKIWRMQDWAKTPWEYIGETPAHFWDEYAYIAPTVNDSSAAGVPYYTYLVSAETDNPYAFYNSLADSGYSVDNLAPDPPKGLYGYQQESLIKLFWDQAGETDFDYYALYKSDDPENFPIDPYMTLLDTIYDDPDLSSDTIYYKLTTYDYNGNESLPSEILEIITGKSLDMKLFLEGPFFISQMIPFLNLGGYIPLTQPYNQPPWNYTGDEAVIQIPNSDIVDWVLLEFRDATDPASADGSTVIYRTAAFLKGDGTIVGLDGTNPPKINVDYSQNLYLVVWHRNHIGILSALPVEETEGSLAYDFTDSPDKVWGGNMASKFLYNGIWGLMAADGNADGQIDNKDKNDVWYLQRFLSGYLQGDFDMDSQVGSDDKLLWEENVGKSGFVPD